MSTVLIISKRAPVSRNRSEESYDVVVGVQKRGEDRCSKYLEVKAVGSTLCPHSLEEAQGRAHIQRAELTLGIWTSFSTKLLLEDMIFACEESLSAPSYEMLKTVDEVYLVGKMYSNPKFVEDVVRDCFKLVSNWGLVGRAKVRAVAYESIHKHNAVAEVEGPLPKGPSRRNLA